MSKKLILTATLVAILTLALATAFTANPLIIDKADRQVKMTLLKFIPGKGLVLRFQLYGRFTKEELTGSISIINGGDVRSMRCAYKDNSIKNVQCVAQNLTSTFYGGEPAVVNFAGFTFPVVIPYIPDHQ